MRFYLGQVVATPSVLEAVDKLTIAKSLARHQSGDWGEVCSEDKATNDDALHNEGRLMSSYHAPSGETFWIITEWDRSVTTVLLPSDY